MKKILDLILIFILASGTLFIASCSNDEPSLSDDNNPRSKFIDSSRSGEQIGYNSGAFGWKLLAASNNGEANAVVSPLNTAMNLSMLCNGLEGDSRRETLDILGFETFSIEDVNYFFYTMLANSPKADKKTNLKICNSVWIVGDASATSAFKSVATSEYMSNIIDIDAAKYKSSLNSWLNQNSQGKVSQWDFSENDAINKNEENFMSIMTLFDFESVWKYKFDKKDTKEGTFTDISGASKMVDFMHKSYQGTVVFGDTYTLIELDLGNAQYTLAAILPDEGVDMNICLEEVSDMWCNYKNHFDSRQITLSLPKFKLSGTTAMKSALQKMGIEKIFTEYRDFTGFNGLNHIQDISQMNSFEINEDGAKATSVTKTDLVGFSSYVPSGLPLDITFNRPFAVAIYEHDSQALLIASVINHL